MSTAPVPRGLVDDEGATLLDRALDAVMGLSHLRSQRQAVALALAARAPDALDPEAAAMTAAVEHAGRIAEGESADLDRLTRAATDAWTEAQRHHLSRAALRRLDYELVRRVRATLVEHVDQALDVVRGDLDDVLDVARPTLGDLDGCATADDAITAGLVEQWQRARALAQRHDHVRDVQRVIVSAVLPTRDAPDDPAQWYVSPDGAALVDRAGYQSDAPEVLAALVPGPRPAGGWRLEDHRPDVAAPVAPWLVGDPLDRLRHATATPATWLPSLAALRATDADAAAAISAARQRASATEAETDRPLDGPSALARQYAARAVG